MAVLTYRLNMVLAMASIFSLFFSLVVSQGQGRGAPSVRAPLFITPLKELPQPRHKTSKFYSPPKRNEFFLKVTMWDLWKNASKSLEYLLGLSVYELIVLADRLYNTSVLQTSNLQVYMCRKYCYDLDLNDISLATYYNMSYLTGETLQPITFRGLHNATVKTLEGLFCFTMIKIESSLGISSVNVTENDWKKIVEQIAWYAIQCRADILVVNRSELAELVRRNESALLGYNLDMIQEELIHAYENILDKRRVIENRVLNQIISEENNEGSALSENMNNENWSSVPLYVYINFTTNFTIRDMEILYRWQPPQLYALEFISIRSYSSCSGISSSKTIYNISQIILAVDEVSSCAVSLVLSRSINYVQNASSKISDVLNKTVLEIFMKVTGISSWLTAADILDVEYDEGIYIDIPRIHDIMNNEGVSRHYMESLSVPQIIVYYIWYTTVDFIVQNYDPRFQQMLSIYGFSVNKLLKARGISQHQLYSMTFPNAHHLLLNTIVERYQVEDFTTLLNYSDHFVLNLNATARLPSSEWNRIVTATIRESFQQTMMAFSANLSQTPNKVRIIPLLDGFQSVRITGKVSYSSTYVGELVSCLFNNRSVSSVYWMRFVEYHRFYNRSLVSKMQKKITFETESLRSLLAQRGLSLDDINNETIFTTINIATGLNRKEIECLYGVIINGIIWKEVRQTRLCQPFEDRSLLQIIMELETAPVTQCDINECLATVCHTDAICQNTRGSHVCSCKKGFTGNGKSCSDINECLTTPCHSDATCQNTRGFYTCSCKTGFTGDGKSCTDINECLTTPCHSDATCQNTRGFYTCSCKTGFTGDGKSCTVVGGSTSSSSTSSVVIIGSVIGGLVFLILVCLLVAFRLYRRPSSSSHQKRQKVSGKNDHHEQKINNAAYEPDVSIRGPPAAYSEGGYEYPDAYAELDNSRRVAPKDNYESLRFNEQPKKSDYNSGNYAQLNERRKQSNPGYYAQLEPGDQSNTGDYAQLEQGNQSNPGYYAQLEPGDQSNTGDYAQLEQGNQSNPGDYAKLSDLENQIDVAYISLTMDGQENSTTSNADTQIMAGKESIYEELPEK